MRAWELRGSWSAPSLTFQNSPNTELLWSESEGVVCYEVVGIKRMVCLQKHMICTLWGETGNGRSLYVWPAPVHVFACFLLSPPNLAFSSLSPFLSLLLSPSLSPFLPL